MTVTYHLKIIDNKMKANQAQYDVDRLADIIIYTSGGCFCKLLNKILYSLKNQLKENAELPFYLNGKISLVEYQRVPREAVVRRCSSKQLLLILRHIHRKTPVLKYLFNKLY